MGRCSRQTGPYTVLMFSHAHSPRLGSRRLGGPILFRDLWPSLREELHDIYTARSRLARLDPRRLPNEPPAANTDHRSGADAFT
jgi:hypothetical protein